MPPKTKTRPQAQKSAERDYPRIVTPLPGPKAKEIVKKDKDYSSTSYIKMFPLVVSHGKGAMVEDVDGNRFVDWMAGIAVAATGYAHPKVVSAVQEAAGKFLHMCSTDWYYAGFSDLCERLAKLAPGSSKKRVFLTNSGAEAVEGAIKLARSSTRRPGLIAFRGAFHGRSYGAMSLTSSKVVQRAFFLPMLPGVFHTDYPDEYRMTYDKKRFKSISEYCIWMIHSDLFERHVLPDNVAAIFIEPMLGEGGYIIPPKEFLVSLRELCDKHGILLVFDEIQCGVGRTGKMWAADYFGVEPDILLTAKGIASGMPIGAIIAKESIMKWAPGSHGSTYGGNPVCCAAALATLDIVEHELLPNVRKMGARILEGFRRLQKKYSVIGDIRGVGLFIGVEFVKDRQTKEPAKEFIEKLVQRAFKKGLLLLPAGSSVLRVSPPLVIDEYDVDKGFEILESCLEELT